MRSFVALALLLSTHAASAQLSPRLRLIARGPMPVRRLADAHGAIVVTARIPGGADRLRALGFPARRLTDDVALLEVDRATLQALAQLAEIHVEERRWLAPTLDRAGPFIGAPAARAATGLTGRGVLVGVVDTGADLRHPDLQNADGTTRIEGLLDLRSPADARHAQLGSFGGAIYDRAEIDAQNVASAQGIAAAVPVPELDDDGHGTHVASTAAGNGSATGNGLPAGRYVGIAPEAGLVIAQARDSTGALSDAAIIASCDFLVAEQQALGRPLVANLSIGGEGGPHDGSTNLEVALDQLFPRDQAGRALVVAAGNDGNLDLHASGWALDGEATLPFDPGGSTATTMELWYRGSLAVAVELPGGQRTSWAEAGTQLDEMIGGLQVFVDNAAQGPLPSGLSDALVDLATPGGDPPAAGSYRVIVRGRSIRFDAWMVDSSASFTGAIDESDHIGVPATASSAISVGAVITRLSWTIADGTVFQPPGVDPTFLGGPASFSSLGPTNDDRFAPDVAAPGEFVIAALSADAPYTSTSSSFHVTDPSLPADALVADDGVHGVLRGTSQATPMVTGAVALLLQADPTLTSETIREILRSTTAPVAGTAGFSPRVGFGTIDVQAALALLLGERGVAADAARSRVGLSRDLLPPDSEETTLVSVTPRDASGRALGPGHAVTIELVGQSGSAPSGAALGDVRDVGTGRYERTFVAHAQRGTSALVLATVDGVVLTEQPTLWFADARTEIGGQLVASGGCDVGTGGGTQGLLVAIAFVVYSLVERKRR